MANSTSVARNIEAQFEQAGFTICKSPSGTIEVRKSGCTAWLKEQNGTWLYDGVPNKAVQGINCELEDRGYQKFWYARAEGKRFPIRRADLFVIHHFDEEVRHLLGTKTLYNEALGSTNARTVYDRLDGRPDR